MSTRHFNASDHLGKKPGKPRPDFPLFPHNNGCWAKKIRGKLHYFGVWHDPDAALEKYLKEKDDLHAGRKLREVSSGVVVKDLANAFLNFKRSRVDSGELSPLTFAKYNEVTDLLVSSFGKARVVSDVGPDDFAE